MHVLMYVVYYISIIAFDRLNITLCKSSKYSVICVSLKSTGTLNITVCVLF